MNWPYKTPAHLQDEKERQRKGGRGRERDGERGMNDKLYQMN